MEVMPQLGKCYDFRTLVPKLLNDSFKNQKLIAILNSSQAVKYSHLQDIYTIYGLMSKEVEGLPKISELTFLLFEDINGNQTLTALEYLKVDTITEVSNFSIVIEIPNVTTEDTAIISARLKELGYKTFNLDKKNM